MRGSDGPRGSSSRLAVSTRVWARLRAKLSFVSLRRASSTERILASLSSVTDRTGGSGPRASVVPTGAGFSTRAIGAATRVGSGAAGGARGAEEDEMEGTEGAGATADTAGPAVDLRSEGSTWTETGTATGPAGGSVTAAGAASHGGSWLVAAGIVSGGSSAAAEAEGTAPWSDSGRARDVLVRPLGRLARARDGSAPWPREEEGGGLHRGTGAPHLLAAVPARLAVDVVEQRGEPRALDEVDPPAHLAELILGMVPGVLEDERERVLRRAAGRGPGEVPERYRGAVPALDSLEVPLSLGLAAGDPHDGQRQRELLGELVDVDLPDGKEVRKDQERAEGDERRREATDQVER